MVQTDKDPEEAVNTIPIEDDEENADLDEFDRLLNKKQVNKYSKTPNEQTLNHLWICILTRFPLKIAYF